MNKGIKKTSSILIAGALSIMLMATSASASVIDAPDFKTPTIFGHTYTISSIGYSEIDKDNKKMIGADAIAVADWNVKPGYMGVMARLYKADGTLWNATGMVYNDSEVSNVGAYGQPTYTLTNYYSQSKGSFYNGNGYTTYSGYKTPYIQYSTSNSENSKSKKSKSGNPMYVKKYSVNSHGETYGSALSEYTVGKEPDLISAIGTNGVKGYVKAEDLTPKVSSPEEAIRQTPENGAVQTIPLYDVEGTNILGEFELETNYHVENSNRE